MASVQLWTEQRWTSVRPDAPMTDGEMQKAEGGRVQHYPTVIGAVAVVYNLPGAVSRRSTSTAARCRHLPWQAFESGTTARSRSFNFEARRRRLATFSCVHRSDGSGTTYYLHGLPSACGARMARGSWTAEGSRLADRTRRQRQRRRRRPGEADPRLDRIRRACVRASERALAGVRLRNAAR